VQKEKSILVSHLKPTGTAILNHDYSLLYPLRQKTKAKVITFGFAAGADVRGEDLHMNIGPWLRDPAAKVIGGSIFKIAAKGAVVPVGLTGVIGTPAAYAALAAAAVGLTMGLNQHTIAERLSAMKSAPGRLSLIPGVKHTLIIDDTYNSSPVAAVEALTVAGTMAPQERGVWAVLGDMLELGAYTAQAHREVGAAVVNKARAHFLVTVGERARDIARAAIAAGMKADKVFSFAEAAEAGRFIQNKLREGDILLVKGSRGMHMETIVRELMAEPLRAEELLVSSHK
jgi:UDP-N-acetylmuramoyl-tripeptide--D-alanyl-D-alanine ligase